VSRRSNGEVENETTTYFQKAWATFARDAKKGLSEVLGWPLYSNKTGKPQEKLRLSWAEDSSCNFVLLRKKKNETTASFIFPNSFDA